MLRTSVSTCPPASACTDTVSSVGLATIVAALHVAVLAALVQGRHHAVSPILLCWEMPKPIEEPAPTAEEPPSNPQQNYSAGQLALTSGIVVLALANHLHTTRMNGATSF